MNAFMPDLSSFIDPALVEDLAWSLIHFLWEGFGLALAFYLMLPFCRGARARYAAAFGTLIAMAFAPVITFLLIHGGDAGGLAYPDSWTAATGDFQVPAAVLPAASPWLDRLVMAWLGGVLLLSIRLAGGWYMASVMRTQGTQPLPAVLHERCLGLVRKAAISRPVRFLQSALVSAPAVVGWLRPVVLIPVSAITGLSPHQLEAVIMHELAHIRRFDALANLAQMIVETVLFYHPAVWWLSRRIRAERENCCDDSAVALTGDALDYAKALATLAAGRAAPTPVMAASGGVLKQRISRLLGLTVKTDAMSSLAVAVVGLVCLAGCVVAHGADVSPAQSAAAAPAETGAVVPTLLIPEISAQPLPAIPAVPAIPSLDLSSLDRESAARTREFQRELAREQAQQAREQANAAREHEHEQARREHAPRTDDAPLSAEDAAYATALNAAGLTDIAPRQVLSLKARGVTPEFVRAIVGAGPHPSPEQILTLQRQGVTADYVTAMRTIGAPLTVNDIIAMHTIGVTPEYARTVRAGWSNLSTRDLISLRALGVDPADAAEFKRLGLADVSMHEMMAYKALGVTPDYIRALQAAGLNLNDVQPGLLSSFKATGVTPALVKALQSMGIKDLTARDYVTAQVRGLTPDFLAAVRNHNFSNLSLRQLLVFKDANVF